MQFPTPKSLVNVSPYHYNKLFPVILAGGDLCGDDFPLEFIKLDISDIFIQQTATILQYTKYLASIKLLHHKPVNVGQQSDVKLSVSCNWLTHNVIVNNVK